MFRNHLIDERSAGPSVEVSSELYNALAGQVAAEDAMQGQRVVSLSADATQEGGDALGRGTGVGETKEAHAVVGVPGSHHDAQSLAGSCVRQEDGDRNLDLLGPAFGQMDELFALVACRSDKRPYVNSAELAPRD